jgi:hypothetical protein
VCVVTLSGPIWDSQSTWAGLGPMGPKGLNMLQDKAPINRETAEHVTLRPLELWSEPANSGLIRKDFQSGRLVAGCKQWFSTASRQYIMLD